MFFRLKTVVNYGTVRRWASAEVSRFEVSSLEEAAWPEAAWPSG